MADLDGVIIAYPAGMEDLSNVWSDRPTWMGEITDIREIFLIIASSGPPRTYGGLGVNVDNTQVVDPAAENYWETLVETIQAILPGASAFDVLDGEGLSNWWNLQRFLTEANALQALKLMGRINWISLDQMQLGVSVPGIFWAMTDALPAPQDRRLLTAYKLGHGDDLSVSEADYGLTILSGIPPNAPRCVTQSDLGMGMMLIEWDRPDYEGSAPVTAYRVYRGPYESAMSLVGTVSAPEMAFLDTGAPAGSIYCVTAFNGVIESVYGYATAITEPDATCRTLRSAICGEAACGLPYAGWIGITGVRVAPHERVTMSSVASKQLSVTIYPADATVPQVRWSSSNPDVMVDETGKVSGTGKLAVTVITAVAGDGGCVYDTVQFVLRYNCATVGELKGERWSDRVRGSKRSPGPSGSIIDVSLPR